MRVKYEQLRTTLSCHNINGLKIGKYVCSIIWFVCELACDWRLQMKMCAYKVMWVCVYIIAMLCTDCAEGG